MLGIGSGLVPPFDSGGTGSKKTEFTGDLDSLTAPVAAFSVRRLLKSYTGPAMTITSDGVDLDINFDEFGNLDTAAIKKHCGSNDGTVKKWFDQSGNENHATAVDVAKIYDGTSESVITVDGRPTLDGDSSQYDLTTQIDFDGDLCLLDLAGYKNNQMKHGGPSGNFASYSTNGNDTNVRYRLSNTTSDYVVPAMTDEDTILNILERTGSTMTLHHQGTENATTRTNSSTYSLTMLMSGNGGGYDHSGNFFELVFWKESQSDEVIDHLEHTINRYYTVY